MLDLLQKEIARPGDKAAIVPVQRLQDIRQDLEELEGNVELNNFQKLILSGIYQLDAGEWDFLDWIAPSAHHTLYGCMRCQTICPANKKYLNTAAAPVKFIGEDTEYFMQGKPFEPYPEDLKQKVKALEMIECLGVMPRNLKALFNHV